MRRDDPPWEQLGPGKVLHVLGSMTDEVFSFLGPATNAIARAGIEQTVVMIDEPRYRRHMALLHESAELALTPHLRNPVRQWRELLRSCRTAIASGPLRAVHLHGLLPCVVGAWALRTLGIETAVFYSPHGSRSLGSLRAIGAIASLVLRPVVQPSRHAAIVNVPQETQAFEHWKSAALVESPAGGAFFVVPRNEARHPLIVTGGRTQDARSAERLAQLAVLLSGEDLRISFNWIGAVDPVSRARLTAANVGIFDVTSDAECASRLAAGWVYVAPGGTRGFPLFLVEAMASGMPCVALDCAQHRSVIRDGKTGYLCQSEGDMIVRIAALIDSPSLRQDVGAAARDEATRRFGESRFEAKLLSAYALPTPVARAQSAGTETV